VTAVATQTEPRREVGPEGNEVATPRVRGAARRLVFWIAIGVIVVLLVGSVIILGGGQSASTARLSGTNPKPTGAKALIQVLRQDGVQVSTPRSLTKAMKDVSAEPTSTTLVLYDRSGILDSPSLGQLDNLASDLVLIEPDFDALQALAPSVRAAGFASSIATANCSYQPAVRAGTVAGLGRAYRVDSGVDATHCFGSDGAYSFVRVDTGNSHVSVLGSATMLDNASILRGGNAAFALGLFGATKHVVWYLPSFEDSATAADGVIPNPAWVGLLIALAVMVGLAAAFWRGRRLGPIVVERMPVIVRSNETVEGRARLYQKANARLHTIDALRMGTLSRLATTCGLSRRASIEEILGAVASATGAGIGDLRALLVDDVPRSDADLVRMSDAMLELETRSAKSTRPS
jgi:hypothetical protein